MYQFEHGQDPSATLEEARRAAEMAIRLRPDEVIGYEVFGDVYEVQGTYLNARGVDLGSAFEKAIENYRKALQISPNAYRYNIMGIVVFKSLLTQWVGRFYTTR